MEKQEVLAIITDLVRQVSEQEVSLTEDTYVRNTQLNTGEECLDLSSLELVQFVIMLEEKFGLSITNEEVMRFVQVKDILNYIDLESEKEAYRKAAIESAATEIFGD